MGRGRQMAARARQVRRVAGEGGARALALRLTARVERALAVGGSPALSLRLADVADSTALAPPVPPEPVRGRPLRIGWLTSPPSGGSGGHTTMFRMVEALEAAGHTCHLYLYDVYDNDASVREQIIRRHWPGVRASVHDVNDGLPVLDAWVATSWETAHVLAGRPQAGGHRFYFVQDFEPHFYARSSEYALAEDTYRFGFHGITAGGWVADELRARYGMPCTPFEFGADLDVYRAEPGAERDGVVFYAKPTVARRGYVTGMLALERFASRRPDAAIHIFGGRTGPLPFSAHGHGTVPPAELNRIYNTCRVGLSLSFTNVSLIPWELLASGVLPVVNDEVHNRRVLVNDHVRWAPSSPFALADALVRAYDEAKDPGLPVAAAASVQGVPWDGPAGVVVAAIEAVTSG